MANDTESTATLLARVRQGDGDARDHLCAVYLPLLQKWAHGRLPEYARDLAETDDMVQASLPKALDNLESFTPLHEGAFLAYLRKILLNKIRDEIRRFSLHGNQQQAITDSIKSKNESALEAAVGAEIIDKYEHALFKMTAEAREAVILRVEFGFSYPEIATAMNYASANAARMKVSRALHNLAEVM